MENQLKLIGGRIEETRKVLEISVEEMAKVTGVTPEEYLAHERGDVDHSFTFIYHCAERFGVDISALVMGVTPKLSFYSLTRKDGGMPIKRRHDFEYQHLASNFKNRQAEPFLVTAPVQPEEQELHLSTHAGQEFDYILSGQLKVQLGDKVEIMNPGDSIVYNSGQPHGMAAYGDQPCKFLAFVMKGEDEAVSAVSAESAAQEDAPVPCDADLICHRFTEETLDENGNLKDIKFHYPENFNFAYDVLDALAEKKPDAPALIWLDRHHNRWDFSFRDISENSKRAANYLSLIGIKRGDRVMLVLKRHYQYWFILNALHRIGAIAVPVSNQLVAKDFNYRFKGAGIQAVIASADGGITQAIEEGIGDNPVNIKVIVNGTREGWRDFDGEFGRCAADFPRPAEQKASDPMLMSFSSGTTGYPKIVTHSFTYPIGHIVTARWWHNVIPGGVHLTISDTGWLKSLWGKIYGQWFSECAVLAYDFDRFDAADILKLFEECQITTFCAPPTMYRFFIKEDMTKYNYSALKHTCIAGEALNPEVFQQFLSTTGHKMMEGFGQSETTLAIGNLRGMTPKPGSMGKPSPQYNVDLLDPDGNPVKVGEVGEIVIRTNPGETCGMFLGYYNDPEATAAAWHDGVYHTGDTAWRDEDGYFWYVGRCDDLIKSSGYRIGPFEVESVIMELPYVLECAVVGVPDPTRGQLVKAYIVLTKDKAGSPELVKEIQEYVKSHTAPYKYPRQVEFMEALPKTISGKIRRTELRKLSNGK